MTSDEYRQCKEMEETHCCAVCGNPLITVWDGKVSSWRLVCGTDRSHQGHSPLTSERQDIARGKADQLAGPGTQALIETRYDKEPQKSPLLNKSDLASNQLLSPEQLHLLITWSDHLGLKAYLGHTCVFYGNPYVTIDGYYYLLAKRRSDIRVSTRPLIEQERITHRVGEDDHAWIAEGRDPRGNLIGNGLGIVTQEEIKGKSDKKMDQYRAPVVHAHPQRMAEKRAEWQLLRKLIPLDAEAAKEGK